MFDYFKSTLESVWSNVSQREPQRIIIPGNQQRPAIHIAQPSTSASVLPATSGHRISTTAKQKKTVITTQPKTSIKVPILVAKSTLTAPQSQPIAIIPDVRRTKVHSEVQHTQSSVSVSTVVTTSHSKAPEHQNTPGDTHPCPLPHPLRDKRPISSLVVTSPPKRLELDATTTSSCPAHIQSNINQAFTDNVQPNHAQWALSALSIPTGKRRPVQLKEKDLETLQRGRWLNDAVINASFSILDAQQSKSSQTSRVKRFDSFEPDRISRSTLDTQQYDHLGPIARYDFLVFPTLINGCHWILIVIDVKKKSIFSVDSLNSHKQAQEKIKTIQTGLSNVYIKKQDQASAGQVKALTMRYKSITKQDGRDDCGPAMIRIATYFYQRNGYIPENLTSTDYTNFRDTIIRTLRGCSNTSPPSHT